MRNIDTIWRKRGFVPALFLSTVLASIALDGFDLMEPAWKYVDTFVGFFTAILATGLWFASRHENLPLRLTVHFTFGDEQLHMVEQAFLPHEGDARQLAQQIGAQLKKGRLNFDATKIRERSRGPERRLDRPGWVYALHLELPLSSEDAAFFREHVHTPQQQALRVLVEQVVRDRLAAGPEGAR